MSLPVGHKRQKVEQCRSGWTKVKSCGSRAGMHLVCFRRNIVGGFQLGKRKSHLDSLGVFGVVAKTKRI